MLVMLTALLGVLAASLNDFVAMLPDFNRALTRKIVQLVSISPFSTCISIRAHAATYGFRTADDWATTLMTQLSGAMASIVLLVMTVIFMLFEVRHLPYKLRFALNNPRLHIAGLHRALKGVTHYLALKTLISLWTGLIVWLGLLAMGCSSR